MNKAIIKKVDHFFNKEFVKDTIKLSIIKNDNGTYELFDQYQIISENKRYKVEINHRLDTAYFYTLKNAVTWVIFHKRNRIKELARIQQLDQKVESMDFSISHLKNMIFRSNNVENKTIYSAKLSQDEAVRHRIISELLDYANNASIWQAKLFSRKEQN